MDSLLQLAELPPEVRSGMKWSPDRSVAPPDWSDAGALAQWIGRVRSIAFIGGARGNRVNEIEAELIVHFVSAALRARHSQGVSDNG